MDSKICTAEMCCIYSHANKGRCVQCKGQAWQDGDDCLQQAQPAAAPPSQIASAVDGAREPMLAAGHGDHLAAAGPAAPEAAASTAMPEGSSFHHHLPAASPHGQAQAASPNKPLPQSEAVAADDLATGEVSMDQAVREQCPEVPVAAADDVTMGRAFTDQSVRESRPGRVPAAAVPAEQPQPNLPEASMAALPVQAQAISDMPEAAAADASGTAALPDVAMPSPATAASNPAGEPLPDQAEDMLSAAAQETSQAQHQLHDAKQLPAAAELPKRNMTEDVGIDAPTEEPQAHCPAQEPRHLPAADQPHQDVGQGLAGAALPEGLQAQHQAHDAKLFPSAMEATAAAAPAENDHPLIHTAHLVAATASAVPMQSSNFDAAPGTGQLLPEQCDLTAKTTQPSCIVSQTAGPEPGRACSAAFPAEMVGSESYRDSCDLAEIIFQKWQGDMLSSGYRSYEGIANRFMTLVCQLRLQDLAVKFLDQLKVRLALRDRLKKHASHCTTS